MIATRSLARVAGLLYLAVGVFGGFALGYFQPLLSVPGDAGATLSQIQRHAGLVPWGVMADLTQATCFVFLALVLHHLLKGFGPGRARAMLLLVVMAATIMALNNVFVFGAFQVATEPSYLATLGVAGHQAIAYLLLQLQHTGVLIAQIFFGLWLVPLGLLAWESRLFPRWMGALAVVGGVAYLIDLLAQFLMPSLGSALKPWIGLPSAAAEILFVGYLLVVGIRSEPSDRGPRPTTEPAAPSAGS